MSASTVSIEHQRFGRIELPESEVLEFEHLPGFPEARRFAILAHDRASAFLWLVSLDRGDLAFVVTHPHAFFPDYDVVVHRRYLSALDAKEPDAVEVLAIANLRGDEVTLNLAAPILVNAAGGRGMQVVLESGDWSTRQPLPKLAPEAVAEPRPPGDQIESKPQR